MDLFSSAPGASAPLAYRMRPRTLDEFVGQPHIVGKGRLLRRLIQADQVSSLIFYGPPGTGKTTLAQVIANSTRSHFITMNAVLAGVKELREAVEVAKKNRDLYGRRTTLFIDEVHRWNKAQQDALLPWVENGTVILVGATTENPYFEVNRALVSRSRIFQLVSLEEEDLRAVARAALADKERGYGAFKVRISDDAMDHLVKISNGDARSLLNALEPPPHKVLTFSPAAGANARWIERLSSSRSAALSAIRERIFAPLPIRRHSTILDADARTGLLLWDALRPAPEGGIWGIVGSEDEAALLEHRMRELEQGVRPVILRPGRSLVELARSTAAGDDGSLVAATGMDPAVRVDFVIGRDLFTRVSAADRGALARLLLALLAPGGTVSLAQVVPALGQRLSALAGPDEPALARKLADAEERAYSDASSPLVSWRETDLAEAFRSAGANEAEVQLERFPDSRRITDRELEAWLAPDSAYGRALAAGLTAAELDRVRSAFRSQLFGKATAWTSPVAFLIARK